MSILPRRDENMDKTRSAMQKRINNLKKLVTCANLSAQRKNIKAQRVHSFIHKLILDERITKTELKDFLNLKKEKQ